jgi:hypothetical protein
MATVLRFSDHRRKHRRVFFSRGELQQLLTLYSRQVMRGEWRDYAIDQRDGAAVFSVFRRALESPTFTFVKTAPGLGRQGDYAILQGRQRLAVGATLGDVLASFQRRLGPTALPTDAFRSDEGRR